MAMIEAAVGNSDVGFNVRLNGQQKEQQQQHQQKINIEERRDNRKSSNDISLDIGTSSNFTPVVVSVDVHLQTVLKDNFIRNKPPDDMKKSKPEPLKEGDITKDAPEITVSLPTPVDDTVTFFDPARCKPSGSNLSPRSARRRHSVDKEIKKGKSTKRTPAVTTAEVTLEVRDEKLQVNQYLIHDNIGAGATSKVHLVEDVETGKKYAMKILSKKKLARMSGWYAKLHAGRSTLSPMEKAYKEISIMKKMNHPNVVKFVEALDNKDHDGLYMVFELIERGEVMRIPTTTSFSEDQARLYFRDVVLGIEYLQYQKIIHRDIKPQNLLLTESGSIKICDLGICSEFEGDDTLIRQTHATPAFTPPEAVFASRTLFCGKALHVWALAVTLYAFIFGDLPFGSLGGLMSLYESIKEKTPVYQHEPPLSDSLLDLFSKMFIKDPARRITLLEIKVHDWVTCNGTMPLPSTEENCKLVEVSPEEIKNAVKLIPKLDTLILIKIMLRNKSFQNPLTIYQGEPLYKTDSDSSRSSSEESSGSDPEKTKLKAKKPSIKKKSSRREEKQK